MATWRDQISGQRQVSYHRKRPHPRRFDTVVILAWEPLVLALVGETVLLLHRRSAKSRHVEVFLVVFVDGLLGCKKFV
jgi:hypothetical protein